MYGCVKLKCLAYDVALTYIPSFHYRVLRVPAQVCSSDGHVLKFHQYGCVRNDRPKRVRAEYLSLNNEEKTSGEEIN